MRRLHHPALAIATAALAVTTASSAGAASAAPSGSVPDDVAFVQSRTSLLGAHTWYAQTHDGVPVIGGYYAVHTGVAGGVQDGRKPVTGLASTTPSVSRGAAVSAAASHGASRSAHLAIEPGADGARARLVWQVDTTRDKEVLVDARSGSVVKVTDTRDYVDGTGKVFDPNPVVSQQNESLTDNADADSAVPAAAYRTVTLGNLDGSGYLRGTWVRVVNKANGKQPAAYSSSNAFGYTRADDRFEQVNSYYALNAEQLYVRSLGFTDVNAESQDLSVDTTTKDNSWYTPGTDVITVGTGGVDDGEDQEVLWHEYGHAIQDDQVPGFGSSEEAGAIGEGFGDYMAATMSQATSPDTATTPWVCVMDWDSTSYTSGTPHCIRRLDTSKTVANKTGEVHDDGEIWSHALWDINKSLGRGRATKLILEAQFSYAPGTSFAAAANTTVATATALYGATDAATVKAAFHARGIL